MQAVKHWGFGMMVWVCLATTTLGVELLYRQGVMNVFLYQKLLMENVLLLDVTLNSSTTGLCCYIMIKSTSTTPPLNDLKKNVGVTLSKPNIIVYIII